jgi:serine/threonine protein kinase
VSRSEFTHELEGLSYIRERLPAAPPYRAWTNLTFTDSGGAMHEVDALVLGRGRLHLVELKHYRGTLAGNENKWLRNGNRIENSPLLLARRKAQRLSSRLRDELKALARERRWDPTEIASRLPFIQDSVFLHARDLEVRLDGVARSNLFAFGGRGPRALPDIMTRLLEPARDHEVRETDGLLLAAALTRMGIQPRTSTRRAGSWVISGAPIDAGDGWQDWPAEHAHNSDDKVRIRVFLAPAGAPQSTREALRRRVKREFGLLQGLSYDSILRPREFAETDEGEPSLIYPTEARFVPLDELVESSLTADQHLVVLERVADAVGYAHRHRVAHRGLNPHAVLVAPPTDSGTDPEIRLSDWSSVGRIHQDTTARTALAGSLGADSAAAELYEAPEGRLSQIADRQALDIFSLGAVAYHLLSGGPPAADRTELREKLKAGDGLDLAAGGTGFVVEDLRQLVLIATRPAVSERLGSAAAFADRLRQIRVSDTPRENDDPLDAPLHAVIQDRFELLTILGEGSTARGLLVRDLDADEERVLKVGTSTEAVERLQQEADVLRSLGETLPADSGVVQLFEGPFDLPHGRTALLLSSGGDTTVGELVRHWAMSLPALESLGGQILDIMAALDRAGVLHRDVKPANLGHTPLIGGRNRLTLFDFSLARRGVSDLAAGTPPYLDPSSGDGTGRSTTRPPSGTHPRSCCTRWPRRAHRATATGPATRP